MSGLDAVEFEMANVSNICGAILAGGRGRRVDGEDKGLLEFNGRPLIEHAIAVIEPQVSTLIISANRHIEQYERLGYPVINDGEDAFSGPLSGISRVLEESTFPYVLIVPCDMPFLPWNLAERLSAAMNARGDFAAVAYGGGRIQPLCLLLNRDVRECLHHYRRSGGRKVRDWLQGLRYCEVDFGDCPDAFINLNTPEQLNTHTLGSTNIKGGFQECSQKPPHDRPCF